MTDQPSQRPDSQWPESSRSDGTPPVPPSGYEPPRFVPPYGSDAPAVPSSYPSAYGQPGYGQDAYAQPGDQYNPYGQPPSPYARLGNPYSAYGQPSSPYAHPGNQYSAYGQPPYYGMPAEPKTLSIASMVCGIASVIMGWLLLPQIAAIVTGHMALKREPAGKGMSITGLVLGYLCLLGYGGFWLLLIIGIAVAGSSATYSL